MFTSHINQSIDLYCKLIDSFLYEEKIAMKPGWLTQHDSNTNVYYPSFNLTIKWNIKSDDLSQTINNLGVQIF